MPVPRWFPWPGRWGAWPVPGWSTRRSPTGGRGRRAGGFPWPPTSPSPSARSPCWAAACPAGLRVFLLTLAVADDIGSVAVLAIFYSSRTVRSPWSQAWWWWSWSGGAPSPVPGLGGCRIGRCRGAVGAAGCGRGGAGAGRRRRRPTGSRSGGGRRSRPGGTTRAPGRSVVGLRGAAAVRGGQRRHHLPRRHAGQPRDDRGVLRVWASPGWSASSAASRWPAGWWCGPGWATCPTACGGGTSPVVRRWPASASPCRCSSPSWRSSSQPHLVAGAELGLFAGSAAAFAVGAAILLWSGRGPSQAPARKMAVPVVGRRATDPLVTAAG